MLKKTYIAAVVGLFFFPLASMSESNYQHWLNNQNKQYEGYIEEVDREFSSFLKLQWSSFDMAKGEVRDAKPKPVKLPKVEKKADTIKPKQIITIKPSLKILSPTPEKKKEERLFSHSIDLEQKNISKLPDKSFTTDQVGTPDNITATINQNSTVFNFYNQRVSIVYDNISMLHLSQNINSNSIADHWKEYAKFQYSPIINQFARIKKSLNLSDWGYSQLVNKTAMEFFPSSKSSQAFFNFFILVKSEFDVRIAYRENQLFLLMHTKEKLYGVDYLSYDNKRYYALGFKGEEIKLDNVYSYKAKYGRSLNPIVMSLKTRPNFNLHQGKIRNVSFEYKNKVYNIAINNYQTIIDFYKTFPQLELKEYYQNSVNQQNEIELISQLKQVIEGVEEVEQINLLMRFVQNSFKYQADGEQFGKENYFFPEETLYYPYSDCEDRSILFSWLVRKLLGNDVVALDYPGHVAAAVKLKNVQNLSGDKVDYKGDNYFVADPTYMNSTLGMTMPQFRNVKPSVIKLPSFN